MEHIPQVRRAPKFSSFIIAGGVIGAILGMLFTVLTPQNPNYEFLSAVAFFSVIAATIGCGVGAMIAVFFDKKSLQQKD